MIKAVLARTCRGKQVFHDQDVLRALHFESSVVQFHSIQYKFNNATSQIPGVIETAQSTEWAPHPRSSTALRSEKAVVSPFHGTLNPVVTPFHVPPDPSPREPPREPAKPRDEVANAPLSKSRSAPRREGPVSKLPPVPAMRIDDVPPAVFPPPGACLS